MLGRKSKQQDLTTTNIDTLIGKSTIINGDVRFQGGLHIDGMVKGNIIAYDDDNAVIILSEASRVEGEIHAPNAVINGVVQGNIYCYGNLELAPHASIVGNVYYSLMKMAVGAEINGSLIPKLDAKSAISDKNTKKLLETDLLLTESEAAVNAA